MIKLHTLGGLAAIGLLATMGSASAGPISCGAGCTVDAMPVVAGTNLAAFQYLGTSATPNVRVGNVPAVVDGYAAASTPGAAPFTGVYAGNLAGVFASPFNVGTLQAPAIAATQEYLAAQPGGSITLVDGARNTFTMLWGSIDSEIGKNLLATSVTDAFNVTGAEVLASCNADSTPLNSCVNGLTSAIVTVTGNTPFSTITLSNAGTSAFEFVPGAVPAPEPASLAILGTALAGFGLLRRRRKSV